MGTYFSGIKKSGTSREATFYERRSFEMNRRAIHKIIATLGLISLCFAIAPAATFPWGDATHAYISDRLHARMGYKNLNEMWGSLGPDIFNFIFDPSLCPTWLADQTHGRTTESFLKVWDAANSRFEDALAFGFVSHNEAWGADSTAHISGRTFGQSVGYINAKAMVLLETPINPAEPHDSNLNPTFGEIFDSISVSFDQQIIVAHVITEYAIDIMLKNNVDPLIGRKVAIAALTRNKKFPGLLVKAFAEDYATYCLGGDFPTAAYVITSAEEEYRSGMISYGRAISRSEPVAVQYIAEQIVALAPGFLGGPLPIPEADAVELMKAAIFDSMAVCDDFLIEIDATIQFVDQNLTTHGITY
jgi:hypothetical protein